MAPQRHCEVRVEMPRHVLTGTGKLLHRLPRKGSTSLSRGTMFLRALQEVRFEDIVAFEISATKIQASSICPCLLPQYSRHHHPCQMLYGTEVHPLIARMRLSPALADAPYRLLPPCSPTHKRQPSDTDTAIISQRHRYIYVAQKGTMSSLLDLPPETLTQVFSYLDREAWLRLALSHRVFNEVIRPMIFEHLELFRPYLNEANGGYARPASRPRTTLFKHLGTTLARRFLEVRLRVRHLAVRGILLQKNYQSELGFDHTVPYMPGMDHLLEWLEEGRQRPDLQWSARLNRLATGDSFLAALLSTLANLRTLDIVIDGTPDLILEVCRGVCNKEEPFVSFGSLGKLESLMLSVNRWNYPTSLAAEKYEPFEELELHDYLSLLALPSLRNVYLCNMKSWTGLMDRLDRCKCWVPRSLDLQRIELHSSDVSSQELDRFLRAVKKLESFCYEMGCPMAFDHIRQDVTAIRDSLYVHRDSLRELALCHTESYGRESRTLWEDVYLPMQDGFADFPVLKRLKLAVSLVFGRHGQACADERLASLLPPQLEELHILNTDTMNFDLTPRILLANLREVVEQKAYVFTSLRAIVVDWHTCPGNDLDRWEELIALAKGKGVAILRNAVDWPRGQPLATASKEQRWSFDGDVVWASIPGGKNERLGRSVVDTIKRPKQRSRPLM